MAASSLPHHRLDELVIGGPFRGEVGHFAGVGLEVVKLDVVVAVKKVVERFRLVVIERREIAGELVSAAERHANAAALLSNPNAAVLNDSGNRLVIGRLCFRSQFEQTAIDRTKAAIGEGDAFVRGTHILGLTAGGQVRTLAPQPVSAGHLSVIGGENDDCSVTQTELHLVRPIVNMCD